MGYKLYLLKLKHINFNKTGNMQQKCPWNEVNIHYSHINVDRIINLLEMVIRIWLFYVDWPNMYGQIFLCRLFGFTTSITVNNKQL